MWPRTLPPPGPSRTCPRHPAPQQTSPRRAAPVGFDPNVPPPPAAPAPDDAPPAPAPVGFDAPPPPPAGEIAPAPAPVGLRDVLPAASGRGRADGRRAAPGPPRIQRELGRHRAVRVGWQLGHQHRQWLCWRAAVHARAPGAPTAARAPANGASPVTSRSGLPRTCCTRRASARGRSAAGAADRQPTP